MLIGKTTSLEEVPRQFILDSRINDSLEDRISNILSLNQA